MSARTLRTARTACTTRTTRTRLFAVTALSIAAALSLTACNGSDEDTNGAGSSPSVTATSTAQSRQPSDAPSSHDGNGSSDSTGAQGSTGTNGTDSASRSGGSKGTGNGSGGGSQSGTASGKLAKCGAAHLRITAAEPPRPINHLLLTATNTGSTTCMLPAYPAARFGEAQSVPPVAEDTQPQAVTTLAPGESGYAGVILSSGDGENGHTVSTLTIPFDDGSIATVSLPAKGVYVDDKLTVSYWQSTMAPAVDF
ncbi:DUF4232 domain-containing protein [Streptomyces sp. RY43-2]|uniref:DUF4232 domain-containing protein n=1 Tax=Streptomyces macrolidinus TaxID=2952607 RepID=A0ABT0ZBT7_9ACTN|nr:DUF4232 domain-containing protein [Streptomyces macrolidinus]MCN9241236.1 DUF4232 domain-containing protein [Streptomyces macrolidinus]